jgi:uncharacterized protein
MTQDDQGIGFMAENNTILLARIGSILHGINVDPVPDHDEMGICIEPPNYTFGLSDARLFEQYTYHSAPPGEKTPPGGTDRTIFSLHKFLRLAAKGDPNMWVLLNTPTDYHISANAIGLEVLSHPDWLISRRVGERHLGYLKKQVDRYLTGKKDKNTRPQLIADYGFDTKAAAHATRIAWQGFELLEFGEMKLPMSPTMRTLIKRVRLGEFSKKTALDMIEHYTELLSKAVATSPLPDSPDYPRLNAWTGQLYRRWWDAQDTDVALPIKAVECL